MQQGPMTPPNGVLQKLATSSSPFASPDQSSCLATAGDFIGLYPSIFAFSPGEALPTSSTVSLTPDDEDDEEGPAATANRLYLARLALQYRDLAERYDLCLSHFQDAVNEAESLREENTHLRALNAELTKRFGLLSGKQSGRAAASIADELRRLRLGSPTDPPATSPRSVLSAALPAPRAPLPKSISVRSSGYLKLNPTGSSAPGSNNSNGRIRVPTLPTEEKGDAGEEEALEFEVYNQGMFKTELCNKWEETGACPYGDHCQFAHGIGELRPVIRHPRYKTEVCRMVLAGDPCPYGHRCHFRHALSPSERFHPLRTN